MNANRRGAVLLWVVLTAAGCGTIGGEPDGGAGSGGSGKGGSPGVAGAPGGSGGRGGAGGGAGSGGAPSTCTYNGTTYPLGSSFRDSADCNTCYCWSAGVVCTTIACIPDAGTDGPSDGGRGGGAGSAAGAGGRGGAPGVAGSGGVAGTGGATCTYAGATHAAGTSFPASDGCNTCTCAANGGVGCTKIACPPRDGGTSCALAESYTYGDIGGNAISSDQVVLGPTSYWYGRIPRGPTQEPIVCEPALPACNSADAIDISDILRALADADVQAALKEPKAPLFGKDLRPVDGTVFSFTPASGGGFLLGSTTCLAGELCAPIPAGITKLVAELRALDKQQLQDPACSSLRR